MPKTFRKINALTLAKLIAALRVGGLNLSELAAEVGLHENVVGRYCRALQAEGEAFIEFYADDSAGRPQRPCYKLGQGKDAQPRRISRTEIQRRHRANVRRKNEELVVLGVLRMERSANGRFKFVPNDQKEAA
jgi:DNA-binding IclR family transcriptional regulator